MIDRNVVESLFENLKDAGWNTSGPLLWSYFFVDRKADKLKAAATELVDLGYKNVNIFDSASDEEEEVEEQYFYLQADKEETHSPESLNSRNQELAAFAEKYKLDSYDGMEAGSVES